MNTFLKIFYCKFFFDKLKYLTYNVMKHQTNDKVKYE